MISESETGYIFSSSACNFVFTDLNLTDAVQRLSMLDARTYDKTLTHQLMGSSSFSVLTDENNLIRMTVHNRVMQWYNSWPVLQPSSCSADVSVDQLAVLAQQLLTTERWRQRSPHCVHQSAEIHDIYTASAPPPVTVSCHSAPAAANTVYCTFTASSVEWLTIIHNVALLYVNYDGNNMSQSTKKVSQKFAPTLKRYS